ncbi:MAG: hypothetical protein ACQERB_17760 [Promethearchaeati archaeon]
MVNSHNRSFFGQNTALIIQSTSKKEDWVFFRCIKRKKGNIWEKPSQGEGKVIKISLEELVMMLKVLKAKMDSWSTYHSYNGTNTQISFNWQENIIWINIGDYSKMLDEAQIEIMKLLLEHLLIEKIEFATVSDFNNDDTNQTQKKTYSYTQNSSKSLDKNSKIQRSQNLTHIEQEIIRPEPKKTKKTNHVKDFVKINCILQRATNKAVLLQFPNDKEAWIPRSTIHNIFDDQMKKSQLFLIENWILEKNTLK